MYVRRLAVQPQPESSCDRADSIRGIDEEERRADVRAAWVVVLSGLLAEIVLDGGREEELIFVFGVEVMIVEGLR